MTQEKELPHFLGVACLHCGTPIPVPAIVGSIEAAFRAGTELPTRNSAVFNVRCPACHKEKPYRTREIVNFEGVPQTVNAFAHPGSVRFPQQSSMARTAKA
jgi:hypothetical protein